MKYLYRDGTFNRNEKDGSLYNVEISLRFNSYDGRYDTKLEAIQAYMKNKRNSIKYEMAMLERAEREMIDIISEGK